MAIRKHDWIEYPGYDKAWIAWETASSYLINKIKSITDNDGKTSRSWLFNQLENEWVLKSEFNYNKL